MVNKPLSGSQKCSATLEMKEALDSIRNEDKRAYLKALSLPEGFLETELDPLLFLHFEDFDGKAAADRLTSYWETRAEIFGHRAFLPMNDLTGQGALNETDLLCFKSGICVQLPNDAAGQPVICSDPTLLDPSLRSSAKTSRLRVLMCCLHKFCKKYPLKKNCTNNFGVASLRIIEENNWDRSGVHADYIILENVMPVCFSAVRVLCVPSQKARRAFQDTIFPILQGRLHKIFGTRGIMHQGE